MDIAARTKPSRIGATGMDYMHRDRVELQACTNRLEIQLFGDFPLGHYEERIPQRRLAGWRLKLLPPGATLPFFVRPQRARFSWHVRPPSASHRPARLPPDRVE